MERSKEVGQLNAVEDTGMNLGPAKSATDRKIQIRSPQFNKIVSVLISWF